MLRLEIVVDGEVRYFPLKEGRATLGSSPDNDLVITTTGVSRRHAVVERRGNTITISDAGSKNGVVVGGRRMQVVTLEIDMDVIIGRATVRLAEVDAGDVDLAILFDTISFGDEAAIERVAETLSTTSEVAGKLLRWVRRAGRGTELRELLVAEAREILGATTLMIVKGGLVVDEIAGPMPSPEALQELETTTLLHWIASERDDTGRVCAYYPDRLPSSSWHLDFLHHVGETLEGLPPETGEEEPSALVFLEGIVRGTSKAITAVYEQVRRAVRSDINVLLLGENGTGKDVIARVIHASDRTRTGRFVAVNTAAIPASLLEAELFGVEEGTATDVKQRQGAFRLADHGTIFLDEIAEMPPVLQAKLLHVVEAHEVTPLGGSAPKAVDVRIISATNKDPREEVERGAFRQDLLFRLNGIMITVPPLRARLDDLPELVHAFAKSASRRYKKPVTGIAVKAMNLLLGYPWPGNVRELEHVMEAAVLACPEGGPLEEQHIAPYLQPRQERTSAPESLHGRLAATEVSIIQDILRATGGNRTAASEILGISRAALHKKLKKLGITKRQV